MKAFYENRKYHTDIPITLSEIEDLNFLAHWHPDLEIVYVLEGSIRVGINQETHILNKGDLALCGSNAIHYYDSTGLHSNIIMAIFRLELLKDYYWPNNFIPESFFLPDLLNINIETQKKIELLYLSLLEEIKIRDSSYPIFLKCRMMALFAILMREMPEFVHLVTQNNGKYYEPSEVKPMQEALQYLERNYTQDITLEYLSSEVNLSKFYLSRLFKRTTGMNFNEYLNRIRTDRAEQMIRNSRKPIIEIAFENGFNSIRTFNRVFKAIKGCTPLSLR